VIRAYLGHIQSEIKQCKADDFEKPMYHAFRLAYEIKSVLKGEELIIFFEGILFIKFREKKRFFIEY
jgi:hypothetical protein